MSRIFRFLAPAAVLLVAALILPLAAHAAGYVSVRGSTIHVRAQPGTHAPIRWELDRGYPLRVRQKRGQWLQVADREATLGWVYAPLTGKAPHRIVTAPRARLRAGPGTGQRILATLQRNEILRTLATRGAWAQVQRASGQRGWVATRLTWGW
ncbi:MAG: SH3 domain-containing protein [Comamonadaceae bacterium]|nr:SH3 domain-containing protein [Comamonadaceae bacterium]